ncbi:HAD family hydrolase [Pseudooctadecabacter jejudonensis]|uniref:phosphoglycolate phosphatase n=1 Tax=Pseudooctadecabacter jejudonensis TaxID=1391910 RepID=A0A1Y5RUU4_9RHOB|nr:HAD family hydrolase [Pseudooctadecabacter jejudonensis]SLN23200.1 Pyrophosphatase PpaX [Pseudooctadecabacter jejudonensis]
MSARQIRGVVFDKDGTLFDFNATWAVWMQGVLEAETRGDSARRSALAGALGFDLDTLRFAPTSLVIASTAREIAQAALPYVEETDVDVLLARLNAMAAAAPQVEAAPLGPFLERLKHAGVSLGVATNDGEAPARAHLAAAGVLDRFDFVAGSDSGFGGKPAPGQLLAFCEAVGLDPAHCVMVGDSTHDLDAGRAAGMTCVAVLTGIAGRGDLAPFADVVLPSIADLPDWLGV